MKFTKTFNTPNLPKGSAESVAHPSSPEARCHCGQLVAKLSANGIELKCKRCKRLILLPFSNLNSGESTITICDRN